MGQIKNVTLTVPGESFTNADIAGNAAIATSKLAQRTNAKHVVPVESYRTWDARTTLIPSSAANDDLGLVTGTFGTDFPTLETGDLKAAGSTSRKVGFSFVLPPNFDAGETVSVQVRAGMETTVADAAATIDVECYASDSDGNVGSDLCTTAAQSANSLTLANLDFAITSTSLNPGDVLDVVVTFLVNDAATGTAVTGVIPEIRVLLDTRG